MSNKRRKPPLGPHNHTMTMAGSDQTAQTPDNARPAKRTKSDFLAELIVLVGDSEQRFVLHKAVVCKSAEFFKASVSVQWKDGQDNVVRLPDCTPSTFSTYVGWLYTKEVDLFEEDEKKLPWIEKDGTPLTQKVKLTKRKIDCYQLGDIFLDTGFSNAVMDELIKICEKCGTIPSEESIEYAWQKVPHDGKMMEFMVDLYSTELDVEMFDEMSAKLPAEFVFKIARAGVRDKLCAYAMRQPTKKPKYHSLQFEGVMYVGEVQMCGMLGC